MGFFGSLFSGIASFVSSGIKAVGSLVSTGIRAVGSAVYGAGKFLAGIAGGAIGTALKGLATAAGSFLSGLVSTVGAALLPVLGPILIPLLISLAVTFAARVLDKIAAEEGVVDEGDKAEEVGYRLEEADKHEDWKKREDFASFREYNAYLKEQIPDIDEAKLEENKISYQAMGMKAEARELSRLLGVQIGDSFLDVLMMGRLEKDEFRALLDACKQLGRTFSPEDYFTGKLRGAEAERIRDALLDALSLYYPEKERLELVTRLTDIKNAVSNAETFAAGYMPEMAQAYGKEIETERQLGHIEPQHLAFYDTHKGATGAKP